MNRDTVVKIYTSVINKTLTEDDVNHILMNYCSDKGKDYMTTVQFITYLLVNKLYMPYFSEALEWYIKQHNITILYNKDLKTILRII